MSRLDLCVPLGPGETADSFCSRLALRNGCLTMGEFCLDMGLRAQGISNGTDAELEKLATLAGLEPSVLSTAAIRRDGRSYFHAGQIFNRQILRRDMLRVCPACIAEDIERGARFGDAAPYGRFTWLVSPIRTCAVHDLELVEIVDATDVFWSARHDFAGLLRPALSSLSCWLNTAERRQLTSFELYLIQRLDSFQQHGGWLDEMPFYAAARTCEVVGTVAAHGRNTVFKKLTPAEQRHAGAAGFDIMARGLKGLEVLLNELSASAAAHVHSLGPISLYGQLYRWLWEVADDEVYRPLCDFVREKIMNTVALAPDDVILGQPVSTRRLHSVRSIAQEHSIHPKRLRKLLYGAGLIGDADLNKKDDQALIPIGVDLDDFLKAESRFMPKYEAAAYIDAPRVQFDLLVRNGFIAPPACREESGTRLTFDRADLDAFIQRLLAHAVEAPGDNEGLSAIPEAKRIAHCSAAEIVEMVLAGRLSTIRKVSKLEGYLSILVDPAEIRALVHDEQRDGLSLRQVTRRMRWSDPVVTALIEHGLIAVETVMNPITQMRQRLVSEESLRDFDSRYVSLHALARNRGIHFLKLKNSLEASGIHPALDPEQIGARRRGQRVAIGTLMQG